MTVDSMVSFVYRFRWLLAGLVAASVIALFGGGGKRLAYFSSQVDSLQDTPPKEAPPPRIFDARYDIWFDPADAGLRTYKDIEDRFVAEDTLIVAFEEPDDPWGVFGVKSLEAVQRMTKAIEKVPYVRNVRSLTSNPWIRWGQAGPDEEGLLVTDLFENPVGSYEDSDRMERMIAILGAKLTSKLVGEEMVRKHLGEGKKFEDYIGEPRLIDSIISSDGRTTALQVQVLRTKIPKQRLEKVFGNGDSARIETAVAPAILTNESQWSALAEVEKIVAKEDYRIHIAGMPTMERNFMKVGMGDMKFIGLMFIMILIVLTIVYRKFGGISIPLLIVFSTIMGMQGAIFLKGDLLNNLNAIAPNMMTAIGIADSVHLVTAYYMLMPLFKDKRLLIQEVLKRNWLPVFLTSVTTAVGFFSLTTSDIVPMRMLGYTGV